MMDLCVSISAVVFAFGVLTNLYFYHCATRNQFVHPQVTADCSKLASVEFSSLGPQTTAQRTYCSILLFQTSLCNHLCLFQVARLLQSALLIQTLAGVDCMFVYMRVKVIIESLYTVYGMNMYEVKLFLKKSIWVLLFRGNHACVRSECGFSSEWRLIR